MLCCDDVRCLVFCVVDAHGRGAQTEGSGPPEAAGEVEE